jgi:signal transduction histidine kinase
VDLGELVSEEVQKLRSAGNPGVEYSLELGRVPGIRGSHVQLRSMLGHLVRNAHEALSPAGGTIRFRMERDDRGWIILEVEDNGSGMPSAVQERAVEPFFTTKAGRPGVGLTIAHGIWRRHRGTLALRGQEGVGTTVRLSVEPATQAEAARES